MTSTVDIIDFFLPQLFYTSDSPLASSGVLARDPKQPAGLQGWVMVGAIYKQAMQST